MGLEKRERGEQTPKGRMKEESRHQSQDRERPLLVTTTLPYITIWRVPPRPQRKTLIKLCPYPPLPGFLNFTAPPPYPSSTWANVPLVSWTCLAPASLLRDQHTALDWMADAEIRPRRGRKKKNHQSQEVAQAGSPGNPTTVTKQS